MSESLPPLPPARQAAVAAHLAVGERPLAWVELDLDADSRFAEQLIVFTDQRVLDLGSGASATIHSWPLSDVSDVRWQERAGLGRLELLGREGRLAVWRYSAARSTAVHTLVDRFESHRAGAPLDEYAAGATEEDVRLEEDDDDDDKAAGGAISPLLRLLTFAKKRKAAIGLGFVLTVLGTAFGLVPPYLTIPLLDNVLIPHQMGQAVNEWQVVYYLAGMAGAAIISWLLSWAKTYVLAWASERVAADLRNATYAHLQSLSLEFFGGKRTGDLMSRIGSDTDRICTFLSVNLVEFGNDVLLMLMTATIMFWIDPWLALVTLLPLPAIAWLIQLVRVRLLRGFRQGVIAWGRMTSVLADTIPGIRVVKAFAQEQREIERFRHANDHILETNDRVNKIWSFFGPTVTLLTELGLLVVWVFGAWRILGSAPSEGIRVGVLQGFLIYIARFYVRLESMSKMLAATQRAAASAQRLFEILDRVPSVAEPARPVPCENIEGTIELRDIGFRYGVRPIVEDVTLSIAPGEMIGLVGPSGAGKSTLVNLVCRFYDVTSGAILVDGHDIRQYRLEDYHRNIGIVLQEPFLFYGTIAENIAYGRPDATRAEIIEAARAAHAHEFILRLPDGYDSLVGERGQSLSGGERQRISIARALLIDPAILILDEATSAVDTETEQQIQEALDNLIRGRTTIAIAHRLSTLRRASRLVVMERGRIVEIGPHHELLKSPGTYARLHQAQLEMAQGLVL